MTKSATVPLKLACKRWPSAPFAHGRMQFVHRQGGINFCFTRFSLFGERPLGSFAINNSMFDVAVMFGATALALWFRALRIPILPIVLAVILDPLFERQALVLVTTSGSVANVLQRPIADGFFAITIIILAVSVIRRLISSPAKAPAAED
jgi:TctA family transporter